MNFFACHQRAATPKCTTHRGQGQGGRDWQRNRWIPRIQLSIQCQNRRLPEASPDEAASITSRICRGAKKVIFTACHSGKLKLTFTSPNIISTSPKNVLMSKLISQFFCNLNSSKNFICPLGKLITEFTSPIAKSTSPGLSNTTFFARCFV